MKKINEVTASAPGKIYLFGEHGVMYGTPSIATAINHRMYVKVSLRDDKKIVINSKDIGLYGYELNIEDLENLDVQEIRSEAKYVCSALKRFHSQYGMDSGINLETRSEFSKEARSFGSSSAVVVSTLAALGKLFQRELLERDLFDLGYFAHTVDAQKGAGSGYDIACAVYGGTILFKKRGSLIEPLEIPELPLVYAAIPQLKLSTPEMVRKIEEKVSKNPEFYNETLWTPMAAIVEEARKCLKISDYKRLGELMTINHGLLVSLGVSTPQADRLVYTAKEAGAYGAKMTGGGGDNVIALVDEKEKKRVSESLKKEGGNVIDLKPNAPPVRIEEAK